MTSLSERRNNNDGLDLLESNIHTNTKSHYRVNNNSKEIAGSETLLDNVRMNSLLDKEMNTNSSNKDREKSDRNYENNEQSTFDTTANLSPSSMEVTFSDPQKYDHSSFSKRQSTIGRTIVTNSSHNINDSPLHTDDNTNDGDDVEEEFRDDYIRSGTHFRSLLDQAFHKVANNISNYDRLDKINEESDVRGDSSLEVFQNGVHENQHFRRKKLGKRLLAQDADESNCRPLRRQKVSSESDDEIDSGSNRLTAQLARQKMTEVLSLKRVSFLLLIIFNKYLCIQFYLKATQLNNFIQIRR